MEQYGVITETRGDTAAVNLQRQLICGNCNKCDILSGSSKRNIVIEAHNPIQAEKGRRVVVESDDRQVIFLAFMLYIVPLIGLVVGIFSWLQLAGAIGLEGSQELQAVGAGLGLMVIIFLFIRLWDRRVKDDPKYKPVITGYLLDKFGCDDDLPQAHKDNQEEI